MLNEEQLNLEVRRFLKKVGITSQREIEQAVRAAAERGDLAADAKVTVRVRLEAAQLGIDHAIEDVLDLSRG